MRISILMMVCLSNVVYGTPSQKKKVPEAPALPVAKQPLMKQPVKTPKATQAAKKVEAEQKAKSPTFLDKFSLGTSVGLAGFSGTEATVGGVADIQVLYDLDMKVMGALFGSYRYLPMAVTLQETLNDRMLEYSGVIEGHLFGSQLYLLGGKGMQIFVSGELGLMKQGLYDSITGVSKLDLATMLFAGGGAEWPIERGFKVASQFHIGVGTYTMWQLSGGVSLAF
ncbi:MAG: hypothetical protein AB8C84_04050 [Oligoflexales bacterium]